MSMDIVVPDMSQIEISIDASLQGMALDCIGSPSTVHPKILAVLAFSMFRRPMQTCEGLEQMGRVVLTKIIPVNYIDPVLPLLLVKPTELFQTTYEDYMGQLLKFSKRDTADMHTWGRIAYNLGQTLVGEATQMGLNPGELLYFSTHLQYSAAMPERVK